MTRLVSQASRRNFQTPRRLCNVYSSAKVRSRVYRPNGLVKRLDTHQVSNINKDAFQQGFHYSEVFSDSALFFKSEDFRFPVSRPDDVPYRPDARQIKHHTSRRCGLSSGPFTASRSLCSSLHPSGRLSNPSG
jgi:hypothetical protein